MSAPGSGPGDSRPLRIHARHSDLARLQAYRVAEALKTATPSNEIEFSFRASLGDQNLQDPLWKMPEKGVFTEDFILDLQTGAADYVVHSWKDLPTEQRFDTEVVATMPRADARDVFLFRRDRMNSVRESGRLRILTSSPRRAYNLEPFFKSYLPFQVGTVEFLNVRGNIPTRLLKLLSQDADGLIVAKAALDRLLEAHEPEFKDVQATIRSVLEKTHLMVLPLSLNPTAAAQGALAVEIKKDNDFARQVVAKIHDEATFDTVARERAILASYGGGCHQKIGVTVLRRDYGDVISLRGLTDAGEVLNKFELVQKSAALDIVDEAAIYPRENEEASFFSREPLPREQWISAERAALIWVARETAWPADFTPQADTLVWTAGLKTWRKLALKGVWITGSSEGLGEDEDLRLEAIAPGTATRAVKLTHADAGRFSHSRFNSVATYQLIPRPKSPVLLGRTHFYWMSASGFERAVMLFPEIREMHHSSGPGSTHHHLKRSLPPDAKISIYLSVDDFRHALTGRSRASDDHP